MPTYDYECTRCGHQFEKFQKISAPPAKRCPVCRGKVKRLIGTGAGLIFKGSGFYSTDYRSDNYRQAKKREEKSSSTGGAGEKASRNKDKTKSSASSPES